MKAVIIIMFSFFMINRSLVGQIIGSNYHKNLRSNYHKNLKSIDNMPIIKPDTTGKLKIIKPDTSVKYALIVKDPLLMRTTSFTMPLLMIDNSESKYGMKGIKPDDVASISLLTDKMAMDKYGEKGKNGAIEVTTKK